MSASTLQTQHAPFCSVAPISRAVVCALVAGWMPAAFAQTTALEEVVVSATKRSNVSVQDVPSSIAVFGAEQLRDAKIEAMTDLTALAPGLIAVQAQSPASTRIGLRGLSTPSNNVGFEASVGVVIDGVSRARTGIALAELPELASVEVLRGAQGTLFGRNTSAGVINITTARANPEDGGYLTLSAGNYNTQVAQGAINFAVSDQWAGRLDAKLRERDGFLDDVNSNTDVGSLDRQMVRGQLAYEGENSALRLLADWASDESVCCAGAFTQSNVVNPLLNGLAASVGRTAYGSSNPSDLEVALSNTPTNDISEWGLSVEYNRALSGSNLTSITAYRDWESMAQVDGDQSGVDLVNPGQFSANKVFSQELRLQGDNDRINWLVGAYYMHDEVDWVRDFNYGSQWSAYVDRALTGAAGLQAYGTLPSNPMQPGFTPSLLAATNPALATTYLPPAPNAVDDMQQTTDAFAIFTHNEIKISEALVMTLGLRYTDETKELDYRFASTDTGLPIEGCRVAQGFAGTPLAALGGLLCFPNGNVLADGTDVKEISEDAFSGTAKLAWNPSDDVLIYVSYSRGFKSGGFNLDRAGITLTDGASALDLAFDAEEVDAYELGWNSLWADGSVSVNGALYTQDVSDYQQLIFTGTGFEVQQGDFEVTGFELDITARPAAALMLSANYAYVDAEDKVSGTRPVTQPENTVTGAATVFLPVGDALISTLHLNARYQDDMLLAPGTEIYQSGYTTVNARVALASIEGVWEVALYAQNLTDENQSAAGFAAPLNAGNYMSFLNTPRMYGAEIRLAF
jgi:iron complex outermembrane receptor protein